MTPVQRREFHLRQIAISLTQMAKAIGAGRWMVAGMCFGDALSAAHNKESRSALTAADKRRAVRLADALWMAGEQLMAAKLRSERGWRSDQTGQR